MTSLTKPSKKIQCLIFCLLFSLMLITTACHRPNKIILFNHFPITKDNFAQNASDFNVEQKIYYIFITQKPVKSGWIRVRVLKKDGKAGLEPVKIAYSNDFRLNKDQVYYYTDYLVMHESGEYRMVIYDLYKLDIPLITGDFRVK